MIAETDRKPLKTPTAVQAFIFAAALTLLSGMLIFSRLAQIPGLHLDEAWVGNTALTTGETGRLGPLGMNWYTGPFHVWLVEKTFAALNPGVFELRLPGALLNTFAAGGFGFFVCLVFGLRPFLVFSGIILLLPFYALEARLAWEVSALQNFLCAMLLIAVWRMTQPGRTGIIAALAAAYATVVGSANHLIFFSLPFSLAVGFAIWTTLNKDRRFVSAFSFLLLNLICAGMVLLVKKNLTQELWLAHGTELALSFWAAPALFGLTGWLQQDTLRKKIFALLEWAAEPKTSKTLKYLSGAGLLAFLWFHATAFMGILSGLNVYKRMFSLDPGVIVSCACFVWGALLMALVLREAFTAVKDDADHEAAALFPALALLAYFACFTIFRNTNSMRYYLPAYFVFAFAAAVLLPDALKRCGRKMLIFLALMPPCLFAITAREIASAPQARRPIRFVQGWHGETSAHMLDIAWLAKKLENDKICRFEGDPFINEPLGFLHRAKPWDCAPDRLFSGNYCYTCTEPPYIK